MLSTRFHFLAVGRGQQIVEVLSFAYNSIMLVYVEIACMSLISTDWLVSFCQVPCLTISPTFPFQMFTDALVDVEVLQK